MQPGYILPMLCMKNDMNQYHRQITVVFYGIVCFSFLTLYSRPSGDSMRDPTLVDLINSRRSVRSFQSGDMDQHKMESLLFNLERITGDPEEPGDIIICRDGYNQVAVYVQRELEQGRLKQGRVSLNPHWQLDYSKLVGNYLAKLEN